MSVGFWPRVLVVCALAAEGGVAGAEDTTAVPGASPAATATAKGSPVAVTVAGVPVKRGNKEPPPAVILVPLVGTVMLPLTLPTSVPHAGQEAGAKEKKP